MGGILREDAGTAERILIGMLLWLGGFGLFGGLFMVASGGLIAGADLLSTGMALGGVATVAITGTYVACGLALNYYRSGLALTLLVGIFATQFVAGVVLPYPHAVLSGVVGLALCYKTASDGSYELPVVGTVD